MTLLGGFNYACFNQHIPSIEHIQGVQSMSCLIYIVLNRFKKKSDLLIFHFRSILYRHLYALSTHAKRFQISTTKMRRNVLTFEEYCDLYDK